MMGPGRAAEDVRVPDNNKAVDPLITVAGILK
jgi:hypothetical protein